MDKPKKLLINATTGASEMVEMTDEEITSLEEAQANVVPVDLAGIEAQRLSDIQALQDGTADQATRDRVLARLTGAG